MNVREIREALAEALDAEGYRFYDTIPANAQLPCCSVLWPEEIEYHTDASDGSTLTLVVTVAVSNTDMVRAQKDIDAAISWPGFGSQLEAHVSTAWDQVLVTSASNIRNMAEPKALAADFNIQVFA